MADYLYPIDPDAGIFSPGAGRLGVIHQVITIGTADLIQDAVFDIGFVPASTKIVDVIAVATDMDSAASPAMVIAIGDPDDPDRFVNGGTIGQTDGLVRLGNNATSAASYAAHLGYTEPVCLCATVITAPGTAVAGTLSVNVLYEQIEAGI
jgi:hypothetical protein